MRAHVAPPATQSPAPDKTNAPGPLSRVALVIVNWNLPDDTIACVESLQAEGFDPPACWVVDNGSFDDSVERLRQALPPTLRLLETGNNLGFAGGNNVGIRAALEAGAEWVFLLNNDTLLLPGFRAALEAAITGAPDVRLWSPLVVYANEPERIWALGDRRLPGTLLTRGLLRNRRLRPAQLAALPAVVRVDFLTACALLVHADVFNRVGLLDERYFMYAEDADFCRRAGLAGFRLACATRAVVLHKVSRSSGIHNPAARLWRTGNMARYYRDHARGLVRPLMFLFSALRTLLIACRDLLRRRPALARAGLRGWSLGWFGDPDTPIGRPDSQPPPPNP